MSSELMGCPFCGSVDIQIRPRYLECLSCGTTGPEIIRPVGDESILAWQNRAPMELADDEGWRLFLMLEGVLRDGDSPDKMTQVANQWLAERSGG